MNTRFNLITNYADLRDYIQYIKNNFISEYTNYTDFLYQIISSLTALTTMILEIITNYPVHTDIQYCMKNNPLPDYGNYAKFRHYVEK